jgi:GAF domain-containing protein
LGRHGQRAAERPDVERDVDGAGRGRRVAKHIGHDQHGPHLVRPADGEGVDAGPPGEERMRDRVMTRSIAQITEAREDPEYVLRDATEIVEFRSVLAVPMLRGGHPIGAVSVGKAVTGPFPDKQIALLQTFADQAVIAIENVRLFKELEARNRALTDAHTQMSEALEQQTATSEILQVISASPTDLRPVFETILRSAVHLCAGSYSLLFLCNGEQLDLTATHNVTPEGFEALKGRYPLSIASEEAGFSARAVPGGYCH